jgi:hypothetical protein
MHKQAAGRINARFSEKFFIFNLQIIDLGLSLEPAKEGTSARQSRGTCTGIVSNYLDNYYPIVFIARYFSGRKNDSTVLTHRKIRSNHSIEV